METISCSGHHFYRTPTLHHLEATTSGGLYLWQGLLLAGSISGGVYFWVTTFRGDTTRNTDYLPIPVQAPALGEDHYFGEEFSVPTKTLTLGDHHFSGSCTTVFHGKDCASLKSPLFATSTN